MAFNTVSGVLDIPSFPKSLDLLCKIMPDVSESSLTIILKLAYDVIARKPLPPRFLDKLPKKGLVENVDRLFSLLLVLLEIILRQKQDSIKDSDLRQCLRTFKFTEDCATIFINMLLEYRGNTGFNSRRLFEDLHFLTLKKLDWRVDISISSSTLCKSIDTVILFQMQFSNGVTKTFEVNLSKFNLLRLYVASLLKDMQNLEKKNALKS